MKQNLVDIYQLISEFDSLFFIELLFLVLFSYRLVYDETRNLVLSKFLGQMTWPEFLDNITISFLMLGMVFILWIPVSDIWFIDFGWYISQNLNAGYHVQLTIYMYPSHNIPQSSIIIFMLDFLLFYPWPHDISYEFIN